MSTHPKSTSSHASLLGAWHAQVAATAKQAPWLVRELLRRKQELLPKFTAYYQQLRALPRCTRRLLQRKFASSLAGVALCLAASGVQPAQAATITVGGTCSLIDAISSANTDTSVGTCTAGSGADTIVLTVDTTLTTAHNSIFGPTRSPVVSSAITITGQGHTIAREPLDPDVFRLIAINGAGNLTLQNTTLSGGVAAGAHPNGSGGGIANFYGQLRLEGCTVTGNLADDEGGGDTASPSAAAR